MASYEGLPFLPRRRLVEFTSHWEIADGSEDVGVESCISSDLGPSPKSGEDLCAMEAQDHLNSFFPQAFFITQGETYHTLLKLAEDVERHLEYWLDWATPVHRRPRWLHCMARDALRLHHEVLGCAPESPPAELVKHLTGLQKHLCRLTAFVQVTSFELLGLEVTNPEERRQALRQAVDNVAYQANLTWKVVALVGPPPTRSALSIAWERWCSLLFGRVSSALRDLLSTLSVSWRSTAASDEDADASDRSPCHGKHFGSPLSSAIPFTRPGAVSDIAELPSAVDGARLLADGKRCMDDACRATEVLMRNLDLRLKHVGRPTHFAKFWPVYTALGIAGLACSWPVLRDSKQRQQLLERTTSVCQSFLREWVHAPVRQFISELLRHKRGPEDALQTSLRELQAEEAALARMLDRFACVLKQSSYVPPLQHAEAMRGSTADLAEQYFESSLGNPISNLMNGHLAESCMVQCQRMKVLLHSSLHSMDAVLTQLKWDFLLAGVMPGLTLCGVCVWSMNSLRRSRVVRRRREMVRQLQSVHRYLNRNSHALPPRRLNPRAHIRLQHSGSGNFVEDVLGLEMSRSSTPAAEPHSSIVAEMHSSRARGVEPDAALEYERVGAFLAHLDRLCRLASQMRLEGADWRAFRRDILDLASPELSVHQKLQTVAAMRSTYSAFCVSAS